MNPDLISSQPNYQYVPFRKKTRYQSQTALKKLKVEHYLRVFNDSGMPSSMLEHISGFFQSLIRRNLSIGSLVQYYHGLKRFFCFSNLWV